MYRGRGNCNFHVTAPFAIIMNPERRTEFDSQFNTGRRVKVINDYTLIDYMAYNGVWPTSPRDFVSCVHWRIHEGNIVVAAFATSHKDCPDVEGHVRGELILGGWVLRPTGATSCEINYIVQSDLKGSIPKTVVNLAAESQPMLVNGLRRVLEKDKTGESKTNFRFVLPQRSAVTLQDCLEVFRQVSLIYDLFCFLYIFLFLLIDPSWRCFIFLIFHQHQPEERILRRGDDENEEP